MWFHFLIDSELSCLAKLAKPYLVSGPSYLPQVPNQLHCIQNFALEVPINVYWARLLSVFTIKPFAFFLCMRVAPRTTGKSVHGEPKSRARRNIYNN